MKTKKPAMRKPLSEVGKLIPGQWKKDVKPYGRVHGPQTLFMTIGIGDANAISGSKAEKFEFGTLGWAGGPPYVRSERTGQWFTLTWDDLVRMGIAGGILKEHPEMKGK